MFQSNHVFDLDTNLFIGGTSDEVDWRDIFASLTIITLRKLIRNDCKDLLLKVLLRNFTCFQLTGICHLRDSHY
jgi:hypothetical protein